MNIKRTLLLGILVLFLVFHTSDVRVRAQSEVTADACVIDEPVLENWPIISLGFRAITPTYRSIVDLEVGDVSVLENDIKADSRTLALTSEPIGTGLNLYFVLDQGNRTEQAWAVASMRRFVTEFMQDGLDQVTVITTRGPSPLVLIPATSDRAYLLAELADLDDFKVGDAYSSLRGIELATEEIEDAEIGCSKYSAIIVFSGEDPFYGSSQGRIDEVIARSLQNRASVYFVHFPWRYEFGSEEGYRKIAAQTYGGYTQLNTKFEQYLVEREIQSLDEKLYEPLVTERVTYQISYKSNDSGNETERVVNVLLFGQSVPNTRAQISYSFSPEPVLVTIVSPENRITIEQEIKGVNSDSPEFLLNTIPVDVRLTNPHEDRNIEKVELVALNSGGPIILDRIFSPETANIALTWSLQEITNKGLNEFEIQAVVEDEFGEEWSSDPVLISINVKHSGGVPLWLLIIGGVVLSGLVTLLVVSVLLKQNLGSFVANTGGAIKQGLEKGRDVIRKTITFGNKRPIAYLVVTDGPQDKKGSTIEIYSEKTNLGSDLSYSDFAFYPNEDSTVSGLHCKLESIQGKWWVTALSASGSPTVVNGRKLFLNDREEVQDGSKIQLGVDFQKYVVLEFKSYAPKKQSSRITDVGDDYDMPETDAEIIQSINTDQDDVDSVFDQYRK